MEIELPNASCLGWEHLRDGAQEIVEGERPAQHSNSEVIQVHIHERIGDYLIGNRAQNQRYMHQVWIEPHKAEEVPARLSPASNNQVLHDEIGHEVPDVRALQGRHGVGNAIARIGQEIWQASNHRMSIIDHEDVRL